MSCTLIIEGQSLEELASSLSDIADQITSGSRQGYQLPVNWELETDE